MWWEQNTILTFDYLETKVRIVRYKLGIVRKIDEIKNYEIKSRNFLIYCMAEKTNTITPFSTQLWVSHNS